MSKKILPIASFSPFHCFLHNAFKTDICLAYPQFESWFYTNHVNTYATTGSFNILSHNSINQEVPFLAVEKINKKFLVSHNINIIEFFKAAVDNDNYINTDLDEQFLLYSCVNDNYIHDTFIYGYDDESEIFYMRGFNQNEIYGSVTAAYEEVRQAYESSLNTKNETFMFVHLLKPNITQKNEKYSFDLYSFYTQLHDYIYSTNYTYREAELYNRIDNPGECVFGMKCYKMIRENYKSMLKNYNYINTKLFHTFWEHKNIMLLRLEYMVKYAYLSEYNKIYDRYKDIANASLLIRNLALKYNMIVKAFIIDKIDSLIDKIENEESKVLPMLLSYIEKEYLKYRLPEHPKLKPNEIINASDKNRQIGNVQVYHLYITDSEIYEKAGFDFYNIKIPNSIVLLYYCSISVFKA